LGDRGFFGGPNVGYNYQIGSFVIGAQGSYDFGNANGSAYAYPYSVSADIHGFGSLDGRAGVTWGPALFYGIGGWSIGDIEHSINPIWGYPNLSYSSWQSGWDVGGGSSGSLRTTSPGLPSFANIIGARRVTPISITRLTQFSRPWTLCVSV
jgi:hypothetical protein